MPRFPPPAALFSIQYIVYHVPRAKATFFRRFLPQRFLHFADSTRRCFFIFWIYHGGAFMDFIDFSRQCFCGIFEWRARNQAPLQYRTKIHCIFVGCSQGWQGQRMQGSPLAASFRPTRGGMPACKSIPTKRRTSPNGAKYRHGRNACLQEHSDEAAHEPHRGEVSGQVRAPLPRHSARREEECLLAGAFRRSGARAP